MMIENLTPDQINNLISAGSGLLGAVIGAGATLLSTWLARKMQFLGKITIHIRHTYTKGLIQRSCGYYPFQGGTGLCMEVPMLLDVCNTSGVSRVARDVNLHAYYHRKEVAEFIQLQSVTTSHTRSGGKEITQEREIIFGDNGFPTFVIPANSARQFYMEFTLKEKDLPLEDKQFDELVLTYFDEKDKIHAFHLMEIDKCWIEGPITMPKHWVTMDRRCKYAR